MGVDIRLLSAPGHTQRVMERARQAIDWAFSDRTCAFCGNALGELARDTCGLRCLNQVACERRAELRDRMVRGEPVQIPLKETA